MKRLGELFALDYDLLLYDVTSTYFEGRAKANALAQRGHSLDHRPDCKQVCIGLVVTREGMPLSYEMFAGNRTDVTTVEDIVETMEARYGRAQRVWVMDRGMTSSDNVAWLRSTERRYLIGANKSELKRLAAPLAEARDWREVRESVDANVCTGPDGAETFLLVRSAERQHKEQAMHARFCQRIEEGLARLAHRFERARSAADRAHSTCRNTVATLSQHLTKLPVSAPIDARITGCEVDGIDGQRSWQARGRAVSTGSGLRWHQVPGKPRW